MLLLGLALPVEFVVPDCVVLCVVLVVVVVEFGLGLAFTSGGGGEFGFWVGVVDGVVGFCTPLLFVLLGDVDGVVCAAANAPRASSNADSTRNFFMT